MKIFVIITLEKNKEYRNNLSTCPDFTQKKGSQMMKEINSYQEYLAGNLTELNSLKEIVKIDWADVVDEYPGEYITELLSGIEVVDIQGNVFRMGIHSPERNKTMFNTDCIILNLLAQRVFKENSVESKYIFPLNLEYVCGLVNDARKLLRMKSCGEDLAAFEFEYCLLDIRKGEWKDIWVHIMNDSFGCGNDPAKWDELLYFIEHA